MEVLDAPELNTRQTGILDLPDECLIAVMCRIGSRRRPVLDASSTVSPENAPVRHAVQCSFVCKHWRTIAAAAVQSLSLDMSTVLQTPGKAAVMGRRFCNLTELRVAMPQSSWDKVLVNLPEVDSFPLLHLEVLHIRFTITRSSLPFATCILAGCQNLRKLSVLHICSLEEEEVCTLADAMSRLPALRILALGFCMNSGTSSALWPDLTAMTGLEELHFASDQAPPASSTGRLSSIIRSLTYMDSLDEELSPLAFTHLSSLETLTLSWCDLIGALPESFGFLPAQLSRLTQLTVEYMDELLSLPDTIGELSSLRALTVTGCRSLAMLPDTLVNLVHLERLCVENLPALETLPERIGELSNLCSLWLHDCPNLKQLPESVGTLQKLETLDITGCALASLPESMVHITSLKSLRLHDCQALASFPEGIDRLGHLKILVISRCALLTHLPEGIGGLPALTWLRVSRCTGLQRLPDAVGFLPQLKHLECAKSYLPSTVNLQLWADSDQQISDFSDVVDLELRVPRGDS